MRVTHKPTEEMWAGVLTKQLQGTAFRQMRAKLMNCKVNYEEDKVAFEQSIAKAKHARRAIPATGRVTKQGPTQMLQECVGGSQCTRIKWTRDRQSVGICRVLARSGSQQKGRRLVRNQWKTSVYSWQSKRDKGSVVSTESLLVSNNLGIQCHILSIEESTINEGNAHWDACCCFSTPSLHKLSTF